MSAPDVAAFYRLFRLYVTTASVAGDTPLTVAMYGDLCDLLPRMPWRVRARVTLACWYIGARCKLAYWWREL